MKFIPESATMEVLAKVLGRLQKQITAIRQSSSLILQRSAPNSPTVGQVWFDVSTGSINVFNGSTTDVWTKD